MVVVMVVGGGGGGGGQMVGKREAKRLGLLSKEEKQNCWEI